MKTLVGFALASFLATPSLGQQTIGELFGANPGDRFGAAVAFVGDVDQDGQEDFVVGAPGDDTAGADAGSVTLYSGAALTVLQQWYGSAPGARLGEAVDGAGDVNMDGTVDIIAGAPGASQAMVYSGADGSVIYNLAPASGLEFGTSVAGVGFVDTDSFPDFAVGARGGTGLWVFSGRTGGLHWSKSTATLELDGLGDVDGDGYEDLISGDSSYGGNSGGRVVVFSGLTGAVLREHFGSDVWSDNLGQGTSAVDDIDGDGVVDYAYGVPCVCFASHYVEVRSGASGALIHTLTVYTLGWDVAPAGDLDLDGTPDILVTEPGTIYAFSGADGSQLMAGGSATVVAGGRDVNGDGDMDFLGGSFSDGTGGTNAGRVAIYTLGCPNPAPENYCTAVANSTGQRAKIGSENSTSITDNHFVLTATKCPLNKSGIFFYGVTPTELPVGEGHLCVSGSLNRLAVVNTDNAGATSYTIDLNNPPSPGGLISAGETWYFSFWFRDPQGGPSGFNFSDGLKVVFCP